MHDATVLDCTEDELSRVLDINFKGQFWGCQAAGRHMVTAGRGSIINLASSAIDFPRAGIVCYAVSKAAVSQLVRSLAMEVGPHGVRVNGIAPGYIDTPMTQARFLGESGVDVARRDAVHAEMRDRSPLGRIGAPEDIAEGIHYLASDASSFVTGQMLRINGGVGMAM
jgi:NAD(P)-dependent dehydrogenase (short-subunit alcohol dehydrogenase family)